MHEDDYLSHGSAVLVSFEYIIYIQLESCHENWIDSTPLSVSQLFLLHQLFLTIVSVPVQLGINTESSRCLALLRMKL